MRSCLLSHPHFPLTTSNSRLLTALVNNMITDLPVTSHWLTCGLDSKLASIHRELRFIARTLGRLRHRHNAALVFSSKRSLTQSLLADLQQRVSHDTDAMLKKLFGTPKKANFDDDVESCPSTPTKEDAPPLCLTPGYRPPIERAISVPLPSPTRPARPRLNRWSTCSRYFLSKSDDRLKSDMNDSGSDLDLVTVVVDEQSQMIFELPRRYISGLASAQKPEPVIIQDRSTEAQTSYSGIYLRKTSIAQFTDFVRWTKTGRILQYSHNGAGWLIEHHARRLIDAIALAAALNSVDYECAAITEFLALGPSLTWPEDFVNAIFATTSHGSGNQAHPVRQMIVAIVAAKTCGTGKRKARYGARDRNVERGDRIASGTFWKMYDAYCAEYGPECSYPLEAEGLVR